MATYVTVLSSAADETSHAGDRQTYQAHLAAAAKLFLVALSRGSVADLQRLVKAERHNFGWGYLSGPCGQKAEAAFDRFATFVEELHDAG